MAMDYAIISGYLLAILLLGLWSGKGIEGLTIGVFYNLFFFIPANKLSHQESWGRRISGWKNNRI
jgi:hypothetical protein